jgi:hypothetical protein
MEPQPIIGIKSTTDNDRAQLIHFVSQRPIIWSKDFPMDKTQLAAAWEFIAQALTSPGRGFDGKFYREFE